MPQESGVVGGVLDGGLQGGVEAEVDLDEQRVELFVGHEWTPTVPSLCWMHPKT